MQPDAMIDATGLLCPLPVLRLRKRLNSLAIGQVLEMRADDPAAIVDVPHFCAQAGHEFLEMREAEGTQTYLVSKLG